MKLTWGPHIAAQREADEAWQACRKRRKKKCNRRQKRKENKKQVGFVDYYTYIRSNAWKAKRQKAIRHYGKCALCESTDRLIVHHRHYHTLGREEMKDLQVLCEDCHADKHEGKVVGAHTSLTGEYLDLVS